jgi:hypothetical protein
LDENEEARCAGYLALAGGSRGDKVAVKDVEDVVADVGQLSFDFDAVFL